MQVEIKDIVLNKMKALAKRQGLKPLATKNDVEAFIETLVDFHF